MAAPAFRGAVHGVGAGVFTLAAPTGTQPGDLQVLVTYSGGASVSGTTGWSALGTYHGRYAYSYTIWTRNVPAGQQATATKVTTEGSGSGFLFGYAPGGNGLVVSHVNYVNDAQLVQVTMPVAGTVVLIGVERTPDIGDLMDFEGTSPAPTTRFTYPGDGLDSAIVADTAHGAGTYSIDFTTAADADGYVIIELGLANVAPLAPTITSPQSGSSVADTDVVVDWAFNDPGDTQSRADARVKPAGGPTWTEIDNIVTTATSWAPSGLVDKTQYEIQIRSYDSAGLVSPWSGSVLVTPVAVPAAPTITAPSAGADITDMSGAPLAWSPVAGQTAFQAQRVGSDGTLYEDTGQIAGAGSSQTFTGTQHPSGGGGERWQVRDWTSAGPIPSPWATVDVTITLAPPAAPLLVAAQVPGLPRVQWRIVNPTPGTGQVATAWSELTCTSPDGTTRQVATDLVDNATGVDYLPGAGLNDYRAIAHAASGTTAASGTGGAGGGSSPPPDMILDGGAPGDTPDMILDGGAPGDTPDLVLDGSTP